jgi:hypothetical protein
MRPGRQTCVEQLVEFINVVSPFVSHAPNASRENIAPSMSMARKPKPGEPSERPIFELDPPTDSNHLAFSFVEFKVRLYQPDNSDGG